MATNYPTSIDVLTNPNATDTVDTVSHSDQHANANDAIEALEAKVGADASADTTSHDYKLSNVTGTEKAVAPSSTDTLTNKTLTSPTLNTPVINTGDINTPDIDGGSHDDGSFANPNISGLVEVDLGSDATGDMYYRDVSGNFVRLPIGSASEVLTVASGLPSWEVPSSGGGVRVRAYKSTNQTLATVNVEEKVTFDTEEYDTGADFSTSTFTTPVSGQYLLNTKITQNAGRSFEVRVKINGTVYTRAYRASNGAGDNDSIELTELLNLTASDTVEIFTIYTGTTSTQSVISGSTQSIFNIVQL